MGNANQPNKGFKGSKVSNNFNSNSQANQLRAKQPKSKKFNPNYVPPVNGLIDINRYSDHGLNFVRPNSSNDWHDIKSFNNIKTPKEINKDKNDKINNFEINKMNESRSYMLENHNNLMQNCFQSSKPFQSRNISTNLTNIKSLGSNLESYSFFKPCIVKGEMNVDLKQNRKKNK